MKKTITVFGSSIPTEGYPEYEAAYKLGEILAKKGFDICSGGYNGIMEAVSKGAFENGAKTYGVLVESWGLQANKYITNQIVCKTLFDRITSLVDTGDAYVVLQGGTGTLLELAVIWEYMNKNILQRKPIAAHSALWQKIVPVMDAQIEKENRTTELVKCFDNVNEIAEYIENELI